MDATHRRAYEDLQSDRRRLDRYASAISERLHIDYLSAMHWLDNMYEANYGELVDAVVNGTLVDGALVPGIADATAWRDGPPRSFEGRTTD
jgi:hypothetical protein